MNAFFKKIALFLFFLLLTIGIQWKGNSTRMIPFLDWYANLKQPTWAAPNWLFAPFSSLLCIAFAWIGYRLARAPGSKNKERALLFWFLELVAYGLWLIYFFTKRDLHLAALNSLALPLLALLTTFFASKVSKLAAFFSAIILAIFSYVALLNWALLN